MKRIEKMAQDRYRKLYPSRQKQAETGIEAQMLASEEMGFVAPWVDGFRAAREMAVKWAREHPNDTLGYPFGYCNVCGGGVEIATGLERLGEDEAPDDA